MPFEIHNDLVIEAPTETVWEVITDLNSYCEWNPFVPEASSSFEVGSPFDMKVQMFQSFAQPQRETIFEFVPGELVRYGVAGGGLAPIRSFRSHIVEATEDGGTRYRSDFEISGWLSSVVRVAMGKRMKAGFDAMAAGLKIRAEALHAVRRELTQA